MVLLWLRVPGAESPRSRKWPGGCAPGPGLLLLRLERCGCSRPGVAMTNELDIFVGNTTLIDEDVYRLWLDGYSGLWGDPLGEAIRPSGCFGWVKERSLDIL